MIRFFAIPGRFIGDFQRLEKSNKLDDFIVNANEELRNGRVIGYEVSGDACVLMKPTFRKGKLGMLIWAVVSRLANGVADNLPKFIQMAKDANATYIEFYSRRPGFKRLAKKFKFNQARDISGLFVYRREV